MRLKINYLKLITIIKKKNFMAISIKAVHYKGIF